MQLIYKLLCNLSSWLNAVIYHMSRDIGDDFNLAIWWILAELPNLKIAIITFLRVSQKRVKTCQKTFARNGVIAD